jgi:hypothetical protein
MVSRVPLPRMTISLPCCGQCGILTGEKLLDYVDEDILSPSRRVLVWYEPAEGGWCDGSGSVSGSGIKVSSRPWESGQERKERKANTPK